MKKSLIISILIIIIPITAWARYQSETSTVKTNGIIAEPIVRIEEIDQHQIYEMNKQSVEEYRFKVCNYNKIGDIARISEINFKYNIEIVNTNSNFPIRFELYNSNNNEILNGKNITSDFLIQRNNIYEKEYRLIIYWEDKTELANTTDVNIKVNAFQIKD